jgi:hypothetical protein
MDDKTIPSDLPFTRQRDALFEKPQSKDYESSYKQLLEYIDFYRFPLIMVINGSYGSGKTRMLRGLQICAATDGFPTTFFTPSQYNSFDIITALIAKMGSTYINYCKNKVLKAKVIGTIAGSLDLMLTFFDKKINILSANEKIKEAIRQEEKESIGQWTQYSDPVETWRLEFSRMVWQVSDTAEEIVHKKYLPWLIFIDDMDRVLPDQALELLLGMRSLLGIGRVEDPTYNEEFPPPAIFIVALNVECLRTAIRARYAHMSQDEEKLAEFTEQFIRKYFIFGPQIPNMSLKLLQNAINSSFLEENVFSNKNEIVIAIANLSGKTKLPFRIILQSFDRIILYGKSTPKELIDDVNVVIVLFFFEVIRSCAKEYFKEILNNSNQSWKGLNEITKKANIKIILISVRPKTPFAGIENLIDTGSICA